MPTVEEIARAIEEWAPLGLALPGDPIGLQVGDRSVEVERIAVALDPGIRELDACVQRGCGMLVAHHPLIYRPVARVDASDTVGDLVWRFARAGIAVYAAHTNWDAANGGVNDALADRLGLTDVEKLHAGPAEDFVKLVVFVPTAALEAVTDAMTSAGAGEIGLYRRCAYVSEGQGTFEPQPGAHPAIGQVGARETVDEYRLEMRAPAWALPAVERAIAETHPYEEPAYDVYSIKSSGRKTIGRVGMLASPKPVVDFVADVGTRLRSPVRTWGNVDRAVERVAVVGGAGSEFVSAAHAAGAEAFVTGEVKHHHGLDARFFGVALLEAGHAATEQPGVEALANRLSERFGAGFATALPAH
jgi:dinuclear metal center YbgI/SA1388 family protein